MSIKFWGITAALLTLSGVAIGQSPSPQSQPDAPVEVFKGAQTEKRADAERTLRLGITVDDPSFLKVAVGQEIKQGDVISDNTLERDRLLKQRKSVELQVENLKSKPLPKPATPQTPPPLAPLPPANFSEYEAAIAQAELKLQQARQLYDDRFSDLSGESPEAKAEVDKAQSALQSASEQVEQQQQTLQSMKDAGMQAQIIEHENAKLRNLMLEQQQAQADLEQAKGKLKASFTTQQQQLQNLKIDVQLAQSNLELAQTKLATARSNRKLLEYQASLDAVRRVEESNQVRQNYARASQEYAQMLRDRDYQLAQLDISLSTIDDKLAQLPSVRSPRNGFVRRIKPWVGNNGKYSTVLTISSSSPNNASNSTSFSSSSGASTSTNSPSSPGATSTSDTRTTSTSNFTKPFTRSADTASTSEETDSGDDE